MQRNSVARALGLSLILVRQGAESPRDDEWSELVSLIATSTSQVVKVLIVTDGGGPTHAQRTSIRTAVGDREVRVAVVSESVKVRFIVSSIALIASDIRGFSPPEMDSAFNYLDLSPIERRDARRAIEQLSAQVS